MCRGLSAGTTVLARDEDALRFLGDMKGVPVTSSALHEYGEAPGAGEASTDRIGSVEKGDGCA
jgi:hypothetical protein